MPTRKSNRIGVKWLPLFLTYESNQILLLYLYKTHTHRELRKTAINAQVVEVISNLTTVLTSIKSSRYNFDFKRRKTFGFVKDFQYSLMPKIRPDISKSFSWDVCVCACIAEFLFIKRRNKWIFNTALQCWINFHYFSINFLFKLK